MSQQTIDFEAVSLFLAKQFAGNISHLGELKSGKHSKAFSYERNGQSYVIRFNPDNKGFLKDAYAYGHFQSDACVIPKVVDVGTYQEGTHYCITERIFGETVRDQYNRFDYSSLPLQYETIEALAKMPVTGRGFGEMDSEGNATFGSSQEYVHSVYRTNALFDWEEIFTIPFVDRAFTDHVAERMEYFSKYATSERELLHGDFGNDNVFMQDGKINGIIDWEKSRYGDHFLDVGRVLLYCPNREETTKAALMFYENKGIANWKERAAMGIYHVMLTNYAFAALAGNEASCASSRKRLDELENGLGLKST